MQDQIEMDYVADKLAGRLQEVKEQIGMTYNSIVYKERIETLEEYKQRKEQSE